MNDGHLQRGWQALVRFLRETSEIQEDVFRRELRPWEEEWLRWVRTENGYRLAGSVLPPIPRRLRNLP